MDLRVLTIHSENNGEVLDKREASELLKISTRTVDDWMRKGRIPHSKLPGGTVRFRRSQLLAFIERYQVTADIAVPVPSAAPAARQPIPNPLA